MLVNLMLLFSSLSVNLLIGFGIQQNTGTEELSVVNSDSNKVTAEPGHC